jgi:hypothetical protein
MRSLPSSFHAKVSTTKEGKDVSTICLDELMGSLQIYEINLQWQPKPKEKGIALEAKDESDEHTDLEGEIGLMIRRFNRILKRRKQMNKPISKSFKKKKKI